MLMDANKVTVFLAFKYCLGC